MLMKVSVATSLCRNCFDGNFRVCSALHRLVLEFETHLKWRRGKGVKNPLYGLLCIIAQVSRRSFQSVDRMIIPYVTGIFR